jgi:hypothetical protein
MSIPETIEYEGGEPLLTFLGLCGIIIIAERPSLLN